MTTEKSDKTLDCKGTLCPWPMVKTKEEMDKMDSGQILEVISTDPAAVPDIKAWAKRTDNIFISSKDEGEMWRIYVKKQ